MTSLFHAPEAIATGAGCRHQIKDCLDRLGARRVLIVTDPHLVRAGVIQPFAEAWGAHVFDAVQPDPTDVNVAEGVEALHSCGAEAIVAIGGGSPIDAAKAIAVSAVTPGPLERFQGYQRVPRAGVPVIAVPTTAGTGSEATKAAVITDTGRNVKMLIFDAKLMPRYAFVDYELSMTMPAPLTAHVGVDTLTHGIEAYVSRKANPMTDPLALATIRLTARHLRTAWSDPENREARAAMAVAALQGGMAFTNSSVCLVHGMSRPLGVVFHLAHGLSNAVLLPAVTRYSIPAAPERYADVARAMGLADPRATDAAACDALVDGLVALNRDLRVPSLRECLNGDSAALRAAAAKMASDAVASGSPGNNPRIPTEAEIVALYDRAWED